MRGIRAGFSHLLLAGTLLGAAGCAGDSHVFGFNNSGAYTQVGQPEQVPVTRALASLPQSAGRIVAVIENRDGPDVNQRIVLGGIAGLVGENAITVRVVRGEAIPGTSQTLIAQEIAAALPGVSMRIVDTLVTNSRGPVGLAYGRTGGAGCLYAWQTTSQEEVQQRSTLFVFNASMTVWDIRLRYCREGLSREQALQLSEALAVGAYSDPLLASPGSVAAMPAPVITEPRREYLPPAPEPANRTPIGETARAVPSVRAAPPESVPTEAIIVPGPQDAPAGVPSVGGAPTVPTRHAGAYPAAGRPVPLPGAAVPVTVPVSAPATPVEARPVQPARAVGQGVTTVASVPLP